jgi:hypothetical protein
MITVGFGKPGKQNACIVDGNWIYAKLSSLAAW